MLDQQNIHSYSYFHKINTLFTSYTTSGNNGTVYSYELFNYLPRIDLHNLSSDLSKNIYEARLMEVEKNAILL